ncbi:MAG: aminotransferase class V-fold PLP-dependent enzyme [Deltaproteobacteria bacterium]|nr:aminotransferase class V-fold PLP-dependent enzyme [Deltaproteobacteria bacterium]MCW5805929.1 aminotransferase class V-fold PLP-dependent enzyme [Deltaproteobacteria bacterium]
MGVREVAIVDGRHAEALRDRLALHELPELTVRVLANLSWKNLSGSALLVARGWIEASEKCLVVRGDRPLDLELLRHLVGSGASEDGARIVVSTASEAPLGETRVILAHEADTDAVTVRDLGEDLVDADGVFTGHALVDRTILEALSQLPNPALEHGLLALVQAGRVVAVPTGSWPWSVRRKIEVEDKVTALLEAKRHAHYVLLNPGPVNTTANVKSALVHHDVCHRDSTFSELMVSLTGKLRRIYRGTPHHTVLPITGSGTAAMESALVSTVPPDKKVLIVDNGAFGERLVEVARVHDMQLVHLKYEWGQLVSPADVERALEAHPDIAVVAMIHHETSVGLLNPVREVGALCRRRDALLVVDAVSSLGAEEIDVVRDNIDICYSSANKCLHAVSGASFMCVSPRVWPRVEKLRPKAYYLDMRRYRRYMDELAQTPFTPAVSVYFALDAACSEFLADGHAARFEMYRTRNARLREGLAALGMPSFTATGRESHSIVTCRLPEGVAYEPLYDAVKERGIIVYGCKGVLADRYLQIANMGYLTDLDIERFLIVLAEEIARLRGTSLPASLMRSSQKMMVG